MKVPMRTRQLRRLTVAASNAPFAWNGTASARRLRALVQTDRRKSISTRPPVLNPQFSRRNIRRLTRVTEVPRPTSQSRGNVTPNEAGVLPLNEAPNIEAPNIEAPNIDTPVASKEKVHARTQSHPFFLGETLICENPAITRNQNTIVQAAKKTQK